MCKVKTMEVESWMKEIIGNWTLRFWEQVLTGGGGRFHTFLCIPITSTCKKFFSKVMNETAGDFWVENKREIEAEREREDDDRLLLRKMLC